MYIIFVREPHIPLPQTHSTNIRSTKVETTILEIDRNSHACLLRFDNSAYAYYVMIRESYVRRNVRVRRILS